MADWNRKRDSSKRSSEETLGMRGSPGRDREESENVDERDLGTTGRRSEKGSMKGSSSGTAGLGGEKNRPSSSPGGVEGVREEADEG